MVLLGREKLKKDGTNRSKLIGKSPNGTKFGKLTSTAGRKLSHEEKDERTVRIGYAVIAFTSIALLIFFYFDQVA